MSTIVLTNDTPFILTLPGTATVNESGEVIANLSPGGAGGALVDLSNVNPETGRNALGATSIGAELFTATNATTARERLGATPIGAEVFTSASLGLAQLFLGITGTLSIMLPDVLSANARSYYLVIGSGATINEAWLVPNQGVVGGALTATFESSPGVAMTGTGPLSIPEGEPAGSGYGHIEFDAGNRIENPNVAIKITIGGGNTQAGTATFTVRFSIDGL